MLDCIIIGEVMNEKKLVMNEIHTYSAEVERDLQHLRNACKFGLRKGKWNPTYASWLILRMRQLADAMEEYYEEDFTLDDIQDYVE